MGFKVSDLKNWTVKRDVDFNEGQKLILTIAVKKRSEFEEIVQGGNDFKTAKALITDVAGFEDDDGNPLSDKETWATIEAYPALIMRLASEAVDAQYQAALKN